MRSDDLRKANPKGRLDVLAYNLMQQGVKAQEQSRGLAGLWDHIEPHVQNVAKGLLGNVKVPSEAYVLLGLLTIGSEAKVDDGKKIPGTEGQ